MREGFLVLSRKPGASVYIGDDIEVRVVAVTAEPGQSVPSGLAVRLAIRAPRHVAITRDDAVDKEGR